MFFVFVLKCWTAVVRVSGRIFADQRFVLLPSIVESLVVWLSSSRGKVTPE